MDGKFFSKDDVTLNIEMGRDYMDSDIPATVLLYRVDRLKSKTNSLYGETRAKEKVTFEPVELKVKMLIDENPTSYLGSSTIVKHFAGQLTFTVYEDELKEKQVDITRGDFIGFRNTKNNLTYYEVNDADTNNVSNNKTIGGLGSFYRKIVCVAVDGDQFQQGITKPDRAVTSTSSHSVSSEVQHTLPFRLL